MFIDGEIKVEVGNILICFVDRNEILVFCFCGIMSII